MCFQQGKPCVYQSEDRPGTILTEWPNGVVDEVRVGGDTRTRRWPDGGVETTPRRRAADRPDPAAAGSRAPMTITDTKWLIDAALIVDRPLTESAGASMPT